MDARKSDFVDREKRERERERERERDDLLPLKFVAL